ncbi:sodium-dependent lysophosphatidylcholine symporter 1-like isoform X1 [Harpia harpyja]|uniref:sodium-dependent lysophosphatidylcholine symporter 1-like isoform X1 n=2 Tax=Harpia harpyja TaxID=202280 RepID=UPI0022B1A9DE|nr:sodium-dependent lysophosphatidylcholine symporter 1-like isoform X1 [Harpia harpyja]XP_052640027.1 sodium-dependent lysophosphatidylcholine symporter 1-like isoform X1 [Harpia harpyja]XP_052640036.1 sodium-dependent lysophosphatidylcholine symporter 1-like isoform X1 [Harpia harpyja]XP_052640045.1 sodium-dependent lysophosphatidylcholine symporter 1-like isoform X1 [Harpia harpyja]
MSAVMLPGGNEDAELHRLTQEGALPQRRVVCRKEKPGLPLCRKVCYAVGGIPYQMTGNALGFFLQIFLLDVVQLEPFHVSLIIFLGRAWDAVTDPAVGFLVSKSPRRKYGKLVPWIACSMPFGVLCYCMMWSTLSDATPTSLKFLWYLLMYSFFQTCMTCHHVPYSSLTMFLGGTQRDRDSATAYRMGMEVFSTLLGSGIQGQIVGSYHARMMNSCYVSNETLPNTSTYSLTDSLENIRRAYVFASLVLGSIYCLSCLILIFGVREKPGPLSPLGKVELPFASCLRMIVGHKPYIQLLCGFLFASLAFQVRDLPWQEESLGDEMSGQVIQTLNLGPPARNISMLLSQITQGIFAFFCTHAAGLAGKFQHLVLIMLVTASLSVPFWQWFLGRFGKKTAASLGLVLIIPALAAITQVMHNFLALVFLVIVAGCSMAVLYLLPWSMLPDTVDDFMLRNPSCLNLEALFYSFYVFFNKFAGGLAVGVSTLSLHFAGYHAGDCTHNHSVILALQLLMAPVPISLLLIAIIIFLLYPIDEERRKQMRMEMEAMGHQVQCGSQE